MEKARLDEAGRKKNSRGVHIHLGAPNWVWTTVCTDKRTGWLACEEAHERLREIWFQADKWLVMDYVIMPDHLHFFAAPRDIQYSFDKWVTYWERQFRKTHLHDDWRWQANQFHHRLRNGESYTEKWTYLRQNPVRAGLVTSPEDWPFHGRIHQITWAGD